MSSVRSKGRGWQVVTSVTTDDGRRRQLTRTFRTREEACAFAGIVAEPEPPIVLDVRPLLDLAGSVRALADRVGQDVRAAVERGVIGPWRADAWACAFGLHPIEVWGDEWLQGVAS
jgi:hypothetical protein